MEQMTFAASYSGGKDSALALCRAAEQGMVPAGLLTTYNTALERSWFHGIPEPLLQQVGRALGLPVTLIRTPPEQYRENFVDALQTLRSQGIRACVFGDIDIEEHRSWCTQVCREAEMEAVFPLWQESREALVRECIRRGFRATVTVVDTRRLDPALLGQVLTEPLLEQIRAQGADICGENGEYHSFVWDGPVFKAPVTFGTAPPQTRGDYAVLPLLP